MSLVTFKKLFKAFFNLAQCLYTKGLDIKRVSNNFSNIIKSGRLETIYGSQFKDIGKDAAVNVMPKNSFNKSKCEVSNFNFILLDEKKIKNKEKCNIHNIFHNTFTTLEY